VEDCYSVSIFHWNREGLLKRVNYGKRFTLRWYSSTSGDDYAKIGFKVDRSVSGNLFVRFEYLAADRMTGKTQSIVHTINLLKTSCYFGGYRYWFTCPECERRVGTLHIPPKGSTFACRSCHDLTYWSRQHHSKRWDSLMKNPKDIYSLMGTDSIGLAILAAGELRRKK